MNLTKERRLQAGGYGELWLCWRRDTFERVVVKFLLNADDYVGRTAFSREINLLQRGLPGMISLLAFNLNAPTPFYVMPYADDGSIEKYAGRLSEVALLGVARHIAQTIAGVHEAQLVHGDLKPANILAARTGVLAVADPLGNGTSCTMCFADNRGGTPGYCAPEVLREGLSPAADVYSFGATMYHLCTGRRPRAGEQLDRLIAQTSAPDWVKQLVDGCCAADPNRRPSMARVSCHLGQIRLDQSSSSVSSTAGDSPAAALWGLALLVGVLWATSD